ncbi:MAG: hypothetical protein KF802_02885 [Bdellovibrionaceae bacterium]|nr:hypothetical protein [Pseudobdellovibrionaceae bacterium]
MIFQDLLTLEPMIEDSLYSRCLTTVLESVELITSEVVMIKLELQKQGLMKVSSIEEATVEEMRERDREFYYLIFYKKEELLRVHFNGPTYVEWLKYKPWPGKELKDLTAPTRGRITKTRITVQKPSQAERVD